jgi:hypothetical protein
MDEQYPCDNSPSQTFTLVPTGEGLWYYLRWVRFYVGREMLSARSDGLLHVCTLGILDRGVVGEGT